MPTSLQSIPTPPASPTHADIPPPIRLQASLALSAVIRSTCPTPPSLSLTDFLAKSSLHSKLTDIIQGLVWNHDPSRVLFPPGSTLRPSSVTENNWKQSQLLSALNITPLTHPNLLGRSCVGDLQFLHARASETDEDPAETKETIMMWIEVMYKLANNYPLYQSKTSLRATKLRGWFDDPERYETLGDLLLGKNGSGDVRLRALGSAMGVLISAFVGGNLRRDPIGRVERFSTWEVGDSRNGESLEGAQFAVDHNISNLAPGTETPSGRKAVEKCERLVDSWVRKAPWEEVSWWLDEEVFAFTDNVETTSIRLM